MPSKKARNDAPLWGAQSKPRPLGGDSAAVYYQQWYNLLMELIFFVILLVAAVVIGAVMGLVDGYKHPERHNKQHDTSGKSIVDIYMGL